MLGDVSHHVNVDRLASRLEDVNTIYKFRVLDPILVLPEPTLQPAQGRNYSPQFDAAVLFALLKKHSQRTLVDIVVGIIDSEIYDELFSTNNSENDAVLVSLRSPTLPEILERSGRTPLNYVGLEIAAQLLCIQYRRKIGQPSDPGKCSPPWHIQRLNCLFDWYGISPTNVTKLQRPQLSLLARQYFEDAQVSPAVVDNGLRMAKAITRRDHHTIFSLLARDPLLGVILGAIFGWAASGASLWPSVSAWLNGFYLSIAFLAAAWRVYLVLSKKTIL